MSLKNLCGNFKLLLPASLEALLQRMNQSADAASPTGGSVHPYYRWRKPVPQDLASYTSNGYYIDLASVPLAYKVHSQRWLNYCVNQFDARAAMAILDSAKPSKIESKQSHAVTDPNCIADLNNLFLQTTTFKNFQNFYQTLPALLAMMAYSDFFPNDPTS